MYFLKVSPFLLSLFLVGCGSESENIDKKDPVVIGCDLSDFNYLPISSMSKKQNARVVETENARTIEPHVSQDILINPDIGFTDFHRIDSHMDTDGSSSVDNSVPSYPVTSTVYYRWDWSALQPNNENEFDFTPICNVVREAAAAHKKLAIRITAMEETSQVEGDEKTIIEESRLPKWLMNKISGKISQNGPFVPDFTSESYLAAARNLIQELGSVFDSADYITSIDIGMVGSWGEWNLEDAYPEKGSLGLYANSEQGLFSDFSRFSEYSKMFENAFTQVPRVMLIGSANENEVFLAKATSSSRPSGWRADCLGDKYGYLSDSWSHMDEGYPEALDNAENNGSQIRSIWKQAPVQFETCNDMTLWKTEHNFTEKDVTEVFDYALDHHASLINAKSKPIPDEFQPAVQDVLKKLGYRFELTSLTHSKEVNSSSTMTITSEWKNSGVAPSYYPYRVAYRFVDASGKVEITQETSRNVLDWLPAETRVGDAPVLNIDDGITVPALAGEYDLQIALVNDLGEAKIKLAIDMPQKENWYTISNIQVN